MIADTTFLIDLHAEHAAQRRGPARTWLAGFRQPVRTTVVSVGEFASGFAAADLPLARTFLRHFLLLRTLHTEIAYTAAAIDRELMATGGRLGENDNWIAGFCRYYGEPILSNDTAFDRVRGLRRHSY